MISVIIPLYNKETTIEQSIRSLLTQSFSDFELIVVDDGSTDGSAEKIRGITDERMILICQENGGPSKARNTGVKHARGEWIVFLDADDELLPDALQIMTAAIKRYPDADLVDFNKYLRIGGGLVPQEHPIEGFVKNPMRAWYYRLIAPGCGHSIYRSSFIRNFPYNVRMRRYEDADLLICMLHHAKVYSSNEYTEIHDMNTAAASHARINVKEDYFGYLDFNGKSFWQKMCIYRFFIEERDYYPSEGHRLYPTWYFRYDLFFLYKFLPSLKSFFYKYN